MYDLFVKLLNMSLAASIIVLVIVVLRLLLKKAPRNIICFLWVLVALRLILPFSIQSNLSVYNMMPSSAGTQGQLEYFQYNGKTEKPKVEFSVPALVDDNASPESMTVGEHTSDLYLPPVISIWLAGICVMLLYAIGSYLYLRKKVGASIPRHDGLKMSDDISTPFILGILKPVIYIPSGMDERTLNHVVAHEEAHIKRRDHWWKPLGYFLLTVYWFNPIIWLAYVLLCRDIEMACDEKVIRDMDKGSVAAYSQALLDCSFPRRRIAACPLAFGEVGVKERVKSVLNYKKPAFWIIVVAVVACIVVGVCFLTNPSDKSLSGKLGVSMDMAVAEYNHSTHSDGNFIATNYDVLRITKGKGKTTVYAWVYYAEYSFDGTDVKMESASHIPTAVTFDTSADDSDSSTYDVIEYWIPGDGSDYAKDIREKFPLTIQAKAFDTSGAAKQKEKCLQIARDYYGVGDPSNILSKSSATKWFDALHGDEMVWDGMREINLDEFPGVTFRWFSEKLEAVTEKETITLYTGMPIWSVYFCDLNDDGKPEICSSISFGSGIIDNRVIVADYANKGVYELSDRGYFDYVLTCQDGQLWAEKRAYMQDEVLESGPLMLRSVIGTDGTATPMLMFGQSELQNRTGTDIASDGSTAAIDALREQYPEYFDLPTGKGLEVYVWQMAQNSYSFGVLSGTNRYKSPEELWNLKRVSAEEMKAILSTYDIDEQNIYIYPWQNPISSYIAEYWITQEGEEQSSVEARRQAYVDNIRSMLFD